jgi:hypothetical protein
MQCIKAQGGQPLDTIVIDANLFIWPEFNMQVRSPFKLPACVMTLRQFI